MTEQEKAREFFQREYGVDTEQSVFDVMYRYARERVLAELREACKGVCSYCRDGDPYHLDGERWCDATPIRQRIATLEAEG